VNANPSRKCPQGGSDEDAAIARSRTEARDFSRRVEAKMKGWKEPCNSASKEETTPGAPPLSAPTKVRTRLLPGTPSHPQH
jgi:hypothetical protein